MKKLQVVTTAILLVLAIDAYAKGGCGGGHGCGHGHGGVAAGGHLSGEEDAFVNLRKKICFGYLVYKGDTMKGIITCADNTFSLKTAMGQDSTYMYSIKDSNLCAAMLRDNGKAIYMKRLHDKKLYQLYHSGKLCIYDTYFSFNTISTAFYNHRSKVVYNSYSQVLNGLSVKRQLVAEVNKVYGLNLNSHDYGKKELLQYVSTLQ